MKREIYGFEAKSTLYLRYGAIGAGIGRRRPGNGTPKSPQNVTQNGPHLGRPGARKHNEFKGFLSSWGFRRGPFWV